MYSGLLVVFLFCFVLFGGGGIGCRNSYDQKNWKR